MKIKVRIKITYDLKDARGKSGQVDKAIHKIMKPTGAKWYAQGVETNSGIRDICYDLEFPVDKR